MRKETKQNEIVNVEDFLKNPGEYIINAVPGK